MGACSESSGGDTSIANFTKTSLPTIRRVLPKLLANKFISHGVIPMSRTPAPPDVIGGVAMWIEETFNGIEVKILINGNGKSISFSMPDTRVFSILCMDDYLSIDRSVLSRNRNIFPQDSHRILYEQPDFFDKLEILIKALLDGGFDKLDCLSATETYRTYILDLET